jgi:hypothetical protein
MEKNELEQSNSVMTPEVDGDSTIGAKPINAHSVVTPIRMRFRMAQFVWYILGVIEILLVLRFIFKFIGANVSAGITQFIYTVSLPFAGAFTNVVGPSVVGRSVFDWSILLAMVIYALIAWGLVELLVMSQPVSDQEAHNKLDI